MPSSSLESSLVRILTDSGPSRRAFGVGFLVTPKHIMTCAHVVNDALGESQNNPNRPDAEIILDFPLVKNQPLLRAKILHWLPGQEDNSGGDIQDITVLELLADTPLPSSLHPAALVLTEQQEGSQAEAKVRMCGFPEGTDQGTYTNGLLQGVTAGGLIEIHCRDYPLAPDGEQQQQTYSIKELQEQWKLLAEKLQALEKDHILETRSEERLRLEHRIKETRTDRDAVEQQLTALQDAGIVESDKKASCKSGFDGTPVWAVQENAVCGMVLSMQNRHNKVVTSMIPAAQLIVAFPEMEELSRPANPYLGLEAFGEKDAQLYFGRQETVARIQRIVGEQDFVAVIGASGSGKSSAVFAGLVPVLRRSGDWLIARCLPRKQPFYELSSALVPFLYEDPLQRLEKCNELRKKLHAGSLGLGSIIQQISSQNDQRRFLLIVDQFEELFTLNTDRKLVTRYIESLLEVRQTEGFTVLVTMRADFLESAAGYPALAEALSHCPPFIIPPMNETDLREAVEQPAAMFGVEFEPGLAQLIVQDVGREPGSLPLLEFCLTQLWERQEFRRITHAAYTAIGGVQQALANHADAVYAEFDEQDRVRLRHIFLKLVRPGQGTEDTRQVATLEQIRPENREVITRLADRRLVVTGRVEEEDTVEVVHEALIRRWQTLRQWVDGDREFLVWQEKLRVLLRQWEESGEDEGALLRGLPLDEALKWRGSHEGLLGEEENEFIRASDELRKRELREKEEQEAEREAARQARERQRKTSIAILSAGLVVALVLSGFSLIQWLDAKQHLAKACEQKALAALKTGKKQDSNAMYQEALLLTSAALEQSTPLQNIPLNPAFQRELFVPDTFYAALRERVILSNHEGPVIDVTFSPDGTRLASASGDKTVRIWDIKTGKELSRFKGHENFVTSVAFSPDGTRLASASGDSTVRLWDIKTSRELSRFKGHEETVRSVAFSPDGTRLASASQDKTVRIWDIQTNREISQLKGHENFVTSVAFSPDGTRLASASGDSTVRLWDIKTGKELSRFKGHENFVFSVDFSPNGTRLASASGDKTVRIWNIQTGKELTQLKGHERRVYSVAFSPDGTRLASASEDMTVRLWDIKTGRELSRFKGHENFVFSVDFSSDSTCLASASQDKTVRIWDIQTGKEMSRLKGHERRIYSVAFSPDGTRLASASRDKTVRLWDIKTGRELSRFKGHEERVYSVAFSPDGTRLASASKDKTVRLWDVQTGKELSNFKGHEERVLSVTFSPDGTRLASASEDKTVRLWDVQTGKELSNFKGHEETVRSVAFSPNGTRLASGSVDKTVRIWDVQTGKELSNFKGHEERVYSVAFSPDGTRLASASKDKTVRLWDVQTGKELSRFKGHEERVLSVTFSPDGTRLASASEDKTMRLWDIQTGKELSRFKGHEETVRSVAFSPDGTRLASGSVDKTVRIWNIKFNILLIPNDPTPSFKSFINAVKFLWQLNVQGLELVKTDRRTPEDLEKYGALLNPPPSGQSKFDQVLEWAEQQQNTSQDNND